MRTPSISEDDLMEAIGGVFRTYGYEGASLSRLSEATGLERASLYHRFPGGKSQMAEAVLKQLAGKLDTDVFAPILGEGPLRERLGIAMAGIRRFYDEGKLPCVIDTLSLNGAGARIRGLLSTVANAWMEAFATVSSEAGLTRARARERAEAALVLLEGALVLSRVCADPKYFKRALEELPALLMSK